MYCGLMDAVHVYAHARVGGDQVILQANAANKGINRRSMPATKTGNVQVGHEFTDVGQVGDARPLDLGLAEGRNRDRHVENAFLALGGRDDNFFEHDIIGFVIALCHDLLAGSE